MKEERNSSIAHKEEEKSTEGAASPILWAVVAAQAISCSNDTLFTRVSRVLFGRDRLWPIPFWPS